MKLPKNVKIDDELLSKILIDDEHVYQMIDESITNYLSDKYGYCINGYMYRINIDVTQIEWDMED